MSAEFQRKVGEWADRTFPESNSGSILRHLFEEIQELASVPDLQDASEEAADCYLLLLHLAHKNGFDLKAAAVEKMARNILRTWETEAGAKGYRKHVE